MAAPPDESDLTATLDGVASDSAFGALLRELAAAPAPPSDPLPQPGDVLDEDLELVRVLGSGGMGRVYLARDLRLGRLVAVKVIRHRGSPASDARLRERFAIEARALAALTHPSIVTVHRLGEHGGMPFLVMEHLRGEPLSDRLERAPRQRLSLDEALAIATPIAAALAHAHARGVVHCDLKPQNVFLHEDGRVCILDFGLAAMASEDGSADVSQFAGTPAWMSPEAWRGARSEPAVDLWALGALLFAMLDGGLPYDVATLCSDDPLPPVPTLPEGATRVHALLTRLLAADPHARPSADEAHTTLLELQRGATLAAGSDAPFVYLEAFGRGDAAWFAGRSHETERLRALLRRRALVALVGPSGAGKSSLARAGLAARLAHETPAWHVIDVRPTTRPIESLAAALRALDVALDADQVRREPGRLAAALRAVADRDARPLLVLVDALEDIATSTAADAATFARVVCALADEPSSPLRVVVTLRDDALSALATHGELFRLVLEGMMLVGPPDPEGLRAALVEPATRAGFTVEPALADAVVEALRHEPVPLPLLQLTASRLWERRDIGARCIRADSLDTLGGVGGILVAHAEAVLTGLGERTAEARTVLCALVSPEGRRLVLSRAELIARAPGSEAVLDHLIAGRLLVGTPDEGETTIALAHDALVDRWDRLAGWLDASRAERQFAERLRRAARDWVAHGRPSDQLWRGASLAAALASSELPAEAEVRAFLAASRRRARRQQSLRGLLLAAAALLLTGLAATAWLVALEYRSQQQRAASAREEADALVAFMLDDLHERLAGVGQLDLLDEVARRAEAHYRNSAEPDPRRLATALRHVGDVARARGDLERALAHYDEVIALCEVRAALESRCEAELASVLLARGELERLRGRLAPARRDLERSLAIRLARHRAAPGDLERTRDLSLAHLKLGDVLRDLGALPLARAAYDDALALRESLLAASGTAEARHDLAIATLRLAETLDALGQREAARDALERAATLAQALVQEHPAHTLWRQTLAFVALAQGRAQLADGEREAAHARFAAARDGFARLVRVDPANTEWRVDLAAAGLRLAAVERSLGRLEDADASAQAARSLLEPLVERDPSHGEWQHALALCWREIGATAAEAGQDDAALEAIERARAIHTELAARDSDHARWQHALADDLVGLSRLHESHGRHDDALAINALAAERYASLRTRTPDDREVLRRLAEVERRAAQLCVRLGRSDEAASHARAAYEAQQSLTRLAPDDPSARRALAFGAIRLAVAESDAQRHDEALAVIAEAASTLDALIAEAPDEPRLRRDRAMLEARRGDVLRALGDTAAAAEAFAASVTAMQTLVAERPTPRMRRDLSVSLDRLGDARTALGEHDRALEAYRASLAVARELAEAAPDDVRLQRDLEVSLDKLGDVYRARGEHALALEHHQAALAIARTIAALAPDDPARQTDLVQVHERLARTHEAAGARRDAAEAYRTAWQLALAMVNAEPQDPARLATLIWLGESLARVDARAHAAQLSATVEAARPYVDALDDAARARLAALPL